MTSLAAVMNHTRAVLLDFDGPVCHLFSGRPNYVVAGRLRTFLEEQGVVLPARLDSNRDPLKLLQWVGGAHPQLVSQTDDVLIAEETLAAASALPTPGAGEALGGFAAVGLPVAIVSNNSAQAVTAYLQRQGLLPLVTATVGRQHGRPEAMKPAPDALIHAMATLHKPAETCVFIGDAPTDVEAARAAEVISIGYAKSDRHHAALAAAGADLIIDDMAAFVAVLEAA